MFGGSQPLGEGCAAAAISYVIYIIITSMQILFIEEFNYTGTPWHLHRNLHR